MQSEKITTMKLTAEQLRRIKEGAEKPYDGNFKKPAASLYLEKNGTVIALLSHIKALEDENERLARSLEIIETQFHEQLEDELKPLQQEIEQLRQALEQAEMERDVFKRLLEELDTREKF